MGLDTSHDCWHGPYSMFHDWREALHRILHPNTQHHGERLDALMEAWDAGIYEDQTVPINVLMNHSDCDGEIPAKDCGPLADALESLAAQMPEDTEPWGTKATTLQFIAGLRAAAAAGEPVDFH